MSYRSKDVGVMSDIQKAVYELSNGEALEASQSWEFVRKYIVIDDLRKFLIQGDEVNYTPEYVPNLNLINVDYMFVTLTETKEELEVFNAFIKATGITNYYRTSYTKYKRKSIKFLNALNAVLTSEIKTVKPKKIMIFDSGITKSVKLQPVLHDIQDCFGIPCITTSSIVKMLMNDKCKHGAYKAQMWSDYTKLNNVVL